MKLQPQPKRMAMKCPCTDLEREKNEETTANFLLM